MITYIEKKYLTEYTSDDKQKVFVQIACTSTDTKPMEAIATGSLCLEVDTSKLYVYDEDRISWNEIAR